jgi:hypothetical protein
VAEVGWKRLSIEYVKFFLDPTRITIENHNPGTAIWGPEEIFSFLPFEKPLSYHSSKTEIFSKMKEIFRKMAVKYKRELKEWNNFKDHEFRLLTFNPKK